MNSHLFYDLESLLVLVKIGDVSGVQHHVHVLKERFVLKYKTQLCYKKKKCLELIL